MSSSVDYKVLDVEPTAEMLRLASQINDLQSQYQALEAAARRKQFTAYVKATRARAVSRSDDAAFFRQLHGS